MTIRRVLAGVTAAVLVAGLLAVNATPVSATTVSVANETQYRDALTTLSTNPAGPHVINVTADIDLDDGTDPFYDGSQDLTINGNGHSIDGGGLSRILGFDSSAALVLNQITLTDGFSTGPGGAVGNDGSMTITDSTLVDNSSDSEGGAVAVEGSVTVENSTFSDNTSGGGGGALSTKSVEASMEVIDSTFTGNSNTGPFLATGGGALFSSGSTTISGSNFSDNTATVSEGGAVFTCAVFAFPVPLCGSVIVDSSTFAGNFSGNGGGGGIRAGSVSAVNSTFTGNTAVATTVGGVGAAIGVNDAINLIYATIVDNTGGGSLVSIGGTLTTFASVIVRTAVGSGNCALFGSYVSNGYNYSDDASCGLTRPGDTQLFGADPQLDPLGDYGGTTPTRPPRFTSPLVDAIPLANCAVAVPTDQRGKVRPAAGVPACDIGAVELDTTAPMVTITSPAEGASFTQGEVAVAGYQCSDDESGVASCVGDVPAGQPIDTSTFGVQGFSVTGTDNAGNSATVTATYTVANTPASKADCKKGGWMSLTDDEGVPFKNQGSCVSFVNTGGN